MSALSASSADADSSHPPDADSSHPPDSSPRERLLQAARDVVAADGLEGLTLRAIARRAGVSHGAPLRHFSSLTALLTAVAADGFRGLVAAIDDHLAAADGRTPGPRDRLRLAGVTYVRFALDNPGVFSVTFRPERVDVTDPQYQEWAAASFGQLVRLVEAAQADGWHPHVDPIDLAAVVWAQVHGIAELGLHGGLVAVGTGAIVDRPAGDGATPSTTVPDDASVVLHLADLATRLTIDLDPDLDPRPQRQGDDR